MDEFFKFLFDFLSQFFNGFKLIFQGIINGFVAIFNIPEYIKIIREYSSEFSGGISSIIYYFSGDYFSINNCSNCIYS